MPFSNRFSGEYVYNIDYDAIDPNDLFDDLAMAGFMDQLPTVDVIMSGSKLEDEERTSKEDFSSCDNNSNNSVEEKKHKKRKKGNKNNLNKKVVDTMNKLAHIFTSGDLSSLKEYMNTHIAPDCTLLTPTIAKSVSGREHVYKFYESILLLHPELICEFYNFTAESDDTIYFTFNYDATYFDPENKSRFTNRDADATETDTIDSTLWQNDHVHGPKYEKDEEENREKYAHLMEEHKPVEVTVRGCMRVVYSIIDNNVILSDIKLKWILKKFEVSQIKV